MIPPIIVTEEADEKTNIEKGSIIVRLILKEDATAMISDMNIKSLRVLKNLIAFAPGTNFLTGSLPSIVCAPPKGQM